MLRRQRDSGELMLIEAGKKVHREIIRGRWTGLALQGFLVRDANIRTFFVKGAQRSASARLHRCAFFQHRRAI